MYGATRNRGFGAEVKRRILLGTYVLSAGYYDAYYRKASQARTLIRRDFEQAFEDVDVIAAPTSPTPAFRLGEKVADPLSMYLADIYTLPASLAGIAGSLRSVWFRPRRPASDRRYRSACSCSVRHSRKSACSRSPPRSNARPCADRLWLRATHDGARGRARGALCAHWRGLSLPVLAFRRRQERLARSLCLRARREPRRARGGGRVRRARGVVALAPDGKIVGWMKSFAPDGCVSSTSSGRIAVSLVSVVIVRPFTPSAASWWTRNSAEKGVARGLLATGIEAARRAGGRELEAFPRRAEQVSDDHSSRDRSPFSKSTASGSSTISPRIR